MMNCLRTIEEEDKKQAEDEDTEKRESEATKSEERESKLSKRSEEPKSKSKDSDRGSVRSKSRESAIRAKSKDSDGKSEEFYDARTSSDLDKKTQSETASVEQKKSVASERSEHEMGEQEESSASKPSDAETKKSEGSIATKQSEAGAEVEDSADVFASESEQTVQETPVQKSESKTSDAESETHVKESQTGIPASTEDELPVGVKWIPLGEPEEKEEIEEEIELLEIPTSRKEMILYKKDFMHQATIYISLYEHWKEIAAEAIKELIGRKVMPTSVVRDIDVNAVLKKYEAEKGKKLSLPEDMDSFIRDMARAEEDIPYIFYLKAEPNIDIAIEFGDEELYERPLREHIYGDYQCLYFNLIDKPGTHDEPESYISKPSKEENIDKPE